MNATCTDVGRSELRVSKPDGSLCFTLEVSNVVPAQACENGQYAWRNAAGETVATGSFSSGMGTRFTIECAAGGARASCGPTDCPQRVQLFGNDDCEPGDCSR